MAPQAERSRSEGSQSPVWIPCARTTPGRVEELHRDGYQPGVPPAQPVVRTESHVLDIAYVLGAIALFVLCDLAVKGAKSLS